MKNRISIAIFATGFSGIVGQVLLLRELLIVFSGNEFSIGIILANWLILEAFGSFVLGKKAEKTKNLIVTYAAIACIFSFALPSMVYITRILRPILGYSIGEGVGVLPILYSSFLILLPVSVLHGSLFTFGCKVYSTLSEADAASIGRAYVYETAGTITGGIVWSFLLIPYLHSFYISVGVSAINFLVCVLLLPNICTLLFFSLGVYSIVAGPADYLHQRSIKAQWSPQDLVYYGNTKYGNISVLHKDGQYTFFLDGTPQIDVPVPDIIAIEEFVHLPMLSHPDPKELLILGGGAGGVINEILKHPSVESIDYAELDPKLIELVELFPTDLTERELKDPRVTIKHIDGRLFLRMADTGYDSIFVGFSEPSDLQTNRFFTHEFFTLARKRLKEDGILVFGLPGSLTYLSEELKNLNSSVFHTLHMVFPYVRVIPGDGTNLFLASASSEILLLDTPRLAERVTKRNLKAHAIVPRNIENKLHPGWTDWFLQFTEGSSGKINSDFSPAGVFYTISHWNALYSSLFQSFFQTLEKLNLKMVGLCFIVLSALILPFRIKGVCFSGSGIPLCMVTTGFAGMIFDLALIFTFQVIYGYVFAWLGLLIACFMTGTAFGAMIITSLLSRIRDEVKLFRILDLSIILFTLLLPLVFLLCRPYFDKPVLFLSFRLVILFLGFAGGLLVGSQFPLANRIYLKEHRNIARTAGLFYGADLLGGWFGGLAGGVILLPVLGFFGTCLTAALLKIFVFLFMVSGPERIKSRKEGLVQ